MSQAVWNFNSASNRCRLFRLAARGRAVLLVVFQGGFNARSTQLALTVEET